MERLSGFKPTTIEASIGRLKSPEPMFSPQEQAAADREYNRNAVGALEFMRHEHEKKDKKDLAAVRGVIAGLIAEAHL